jgi:putative endonuclease
MWIVYILQCSDESYYTGVTQNIERRIKEHNTDNKLGSKYVRSKRPARLVYLESAKSKSKALKRENEIKGYSREKKLELIKSHN